MKIKGAKKVHYDSGPNMTPLVDVVMVILIFLMLAGSFAGAEHYLVSNVPFSKQGAGGGTPPPGGFRRMSRWRFASTARRRIGSSHARVGQVDAADCRAQRR